MIRTDKTEVVNTVSYSFDRLDLLKALSGEKSECGKIAIFNNNAQIIILSGDREWCRLGVNHNLVIESNWETAVDDTSK